MRITKISVMGLFGMFDHEIPLNRESRITIVHGPNGVGKTVLMNMVHGLFNYEYAYIDSIPFEHFLIDYDDGTTLTVGKQLKDEHKDELPRLLIDCISNTGERCRPFSVVVADDMTLIEHVKVLRPDLTAVIELNGMIYWVADRYGKNTEGRPGDLMDFILSVRRSRLVAKEMLLNYFPELHSQVYGEMPAWFETMKATKLISTARLREKINESDVVLALKQYLKTTRENLPLVVFPGIPDVPNQINELMNRNMDEIFDYEESNAEILSEIEELERILEEDLVKESQVATEVLEQKLDELANELEPHPSQYFGYREVLLKLLNERFLYKALAHNGAEYVVESDKGSAPFSKLSSGEQNLLVIYHSLFETESDTLVMIDEPELSMNVVWQRNFIKDLQRIIELRNFDVLVATHSPQIIHDKWDWMVALGENIESDEAD